MDEDDIILLQRGPFWEMTTSADDELLSQHCLERQHTILSTNTLPKNLSHASLHLYVFNLNYVLCMQEFDIKDD